MFESEEFEKQLRATVESAAGEAGMKQYEIAIVSRLLSLARENEPTLMGLEMRKAASERRGVRTAYANARVVVKLAIKQHLFCKWRISEVGHLGFHVQVSTFGFPVVTDLGEDG